MAPLLGAIACFGALLVARALSIQTGVVWAVLGAAAWVGVLKSGVDPVVVGLVMGLLAFAYPAPRSSLERATERFREFREQPTAELARAARLEIRSATSLNERLQRLFHPWTSYVIVPLFALANAGIAIDGAFLERAFSSPITLGILFGYVVGKPVGIFGASWLVTRLSRGRMQPPVGWAAVAGGGTIAGDRVHRGAPGGDARVQRSRTRGGEARHPRRRRGRGAHHLAAVPRHGPAPPARADPRPDRNRSATRRPLREVDPQRDHIRGPIEAPVTIVEYGDFECPYCGQAEPVVRELLRNFVDVRYVWRHLPLTDVHPHAQMAAEAAEAAAAQGALWEMHDLLLANQDALEPSDLIAYAARLDLDGERFERDLRERTGAGRVAEDVEGADLSGVSGTPTFFINGRRHPGAYDIASLSAAVRVAGAQATIAQP